MNVLDIYIHQLVPETAPARGVPVAQGHERQIPRRAVGARNARARLRAVGNDPIAILDECPITTETTKCEIILVVSAVFPFTWQM